MTDATRTIEPTVTPAAVATLQPVRVAFSFVLLAEMRQKGLSLPLKMLAELAEEFIASIDGKVNRTYELDSIMELALRPEVTTMFIFSNQRPVGFALLESISGGRIYEPTLWIHLAYLRGEFTRLSRRTVEKLEGAARQVGLKYIGFDSMRAGMTRLAEKWGIAPMAIIYGKEV